MKVFESLLIVALSLPIGNLFAEENEGTLMDSSEVKILLEFCSANNQSVDPKGIEIDIFRIDNKYWEPVGLSQLKYTIKNQIVKTENVKKEGNHSTHGKADMEETTENKNTMFCELLMKPGKYVILVNEGKWITKGSQPMPFTVRGGDNIQIIRLELQSGLAVFEGEVSIKNMTDVSPGKCNILITGEVWRNGFRKKSFVTGVTDSAGKFKIHSYGFVGRSVNIRAISQENMLCAPCEILLKEVKNINNVNLTLQPMSRLEGRFVRSKELPKEMRLSHCFRIVDKYGREFDYSIVDKKTGEFKTDRLLSPGLYFIIEGQLPRDAYNKRLIRIKGPKRILAEPLKTTKVEIVAEKNK